GHARRDRPRPHAAAASIARARSRPRPIAPARPGDVSSFARWTPASAERCPARPRTRSSVGRRRVARMAPPCLDHTRRPAQRGGAPGPSSGRVRYIRDRGAARAARARAPGNDRALALCVSRLRAFLDASPLSQIALALMREATGRTEPLAAIAPTRPAALRRGRRVGFWSLSAGAGSSTVAALLAHRSAAGGEAPLLVDLDRWVPSLALRAGFSAASVAGTRSAQLQAVFCAAPLLGRVPCAVGLVVVGAGDDDAARVAERAGFPLLAAIPRDAYLADDAFAARAPTLRAVDVLLRALA